MVKQIFVCDHCGVEINPICEYSELEIDDFDFFKKVDLCVPCYREICEIVREFVHE